jgi:hypothetical protein
VPVPIPGKGVDYLSINASRLNANAINQVPRKVMFQKKLRLLSFLAVRPLGRLYCAPIDIFQIGEIVIVFEVS